ncbi:MAG: protein kinase [Deltaproteobacteria bacterium]|nr:protein kinase [Deltaproteobacteria bacterium]
MTARRFGPFTLGRRLGSGGMATVFAARQDGPHVTRLVALKVLAAHISPDDPEQRRFVREAQLATRLEHPNIVRTYDVGEIDGKMYLAMELIHGASLLEWSKQSSAPAPTPIAVKIAHDVARALHAAHELSDPERGPLGLVHQDVSPANILVGYDGIVRLLDFGVARVGALEGSQTQTIAGKPSYLSPEQIHGKDIERRTDVFALGIVLWELLAARRLFKRESEAGTYLAVLNDPIPDITTINPHVHRAIAGVISRALDRDRSRRFATAEEMRKALIAARMGAGVPDLNDEDVATFIAAHVPPTFTPADLEREIVALQSRPLGADEHVPASGAVAKEPPVERTQVMPSEVPELDVPVPASARVPAASTSRAPNAPPAAVSARPSAPANVSAPPAAPGHGIAFDTPDDDDFDMQIERNTASSTFEMSQSMRSAAPAAARASGAPRVSATGLEIAHVRTGARRAIIDEEEPPSIGARLAGFAVTAVVLGGVTAALVRFAKPTGGLALTKLVPHAFDGTSAPESGVVALTGLVLAIALGFAGIKLTPRSWAWVGSAGALLLLSLAMVTVTLASTGENPEPPDGALLVPYLAPAALLLFGLGVGGRAASLFAREGASRKIGAVPIAVIAGVLCFVAYASSKLAG